ncbi:MAG: alpha/beta fold hydrolase [Chloroflexi bacterium]|nr:alpha/beta fold hydrolase [Chloroflexota bacterium]
MSAPSERTVSLRGGTLTARVREAGDGPPVIYLHGAEGPLPSWPPFLETLDRSHRMISPDLPGFGGSTGGEGINDVLDLSVYLLDLLDALGLERVAIVGHDLGGMAAAELAAVAGNRVASLALIAPLGLWVDDDPILDFYATPRADLTPLAWHDPASGTATAVLTPPQTEAEAQIAALELNHGLAASTRLLWPIPDRGLKRRIHRIICPALLIWGASDGVVPPTYGPRWKSALSDARLEVVPGAGHYPMLEQPTAVTDAITPFLRLHGA